MLNRLTEQRVFIEACLCVLTTFLYHKTSELRTTTLKQTGSQMYTGQKRKYQPRIFTNERITFGFIRRYSLIWLFENYLNFEMWAAVYRRDVPRHSVAIINRLDRVEDDVLGNRKWTAF